MKTINTIWRRFICTLAADSFTEYRAAAVVIGNEVLSGKTKDTNSNYLARVLFENGVRLTRIETIPDLAEDIIQTVSKLSSSVDYVFTSGGIGPTHDDITYQSICDAFGLTLRTHEPTLAAITVDYTSKGKRLNAAIRRMALLPYPADRIITTPGLWVPTVQCRNVFILPGIPSLFQKMVDSVLKSIDCGSKRLRLSLTILVGESEIADRLANVQKQFPEVEIGSYPKLNPEMPEVCSVQLCFTSTDHYAAKRALAAFQKTLQT
uniref:MoaB/Mog domain-containing protein n=1 Tax=Spongospora subterranea TaxID=70186 RepID=A0A0H5R780_9EUKA|eukprot:CRZ10000.1 hypothetical protein [Spongospora subterranea]